MPRRHRSEPLSPRAAARLRAPRRGYVPSARELSPTTRWPPADAGSPSPSPFDEDPGHPAMGVPRQASAGSAFAEVEFAEVEFAEEGVGALRRSPSHDEGGSWLPEAETVRGRRGPRTWFRLPTSFVGARWEPGRLAVIGLGIAVAVAVALFGLRVAWASGDGTILAPGGGSRAGPTGISAGSAPVGATPSVTAGAGATPSPGASASAGATVVVHVVGQVREPGLQRLPPGSRVADAIAAAGGATRRADLARVNLARVLVDGEQVVVPAPGDPDPPGAPSVAGSGAGGGGGGPSVSLNTADLAGLDTLPGVGPVLAQRILDWRSEHGRFTSVDELGEVSGIGEKLMDRLRPLVTL